MAERTKAQILDELQSKNERIQELEARPVAPRLARVPEAEALAACIRALDDLPRPDNSYWSQSKSAVVERLLVALAARYGVELIKTETVTRECDRPHVDNISPEAAFNALRGLANF